MFETKAQIRAEALRKSFLKGHKEGQEEEKERIESVLVQHRSEIPPDLFDELTKSVKNGKE